MRRGEHAAKEKLDGEVEAVTILWNIVGKKRLRLWMISVIVVPLTAGSGWLCKKREREGGS